MGPPRRDAVRHDALVELAQAEAGAARRLIVAPQRERGHLAEKVAAIRGVVSTAHRLLARRRRRQMSVALEQLRRLVNRPLAAVQANPGDEAADSRERLARLRE